MKILSVIILTDLHCIQCHFPFLGRIEPRRTSASPLPSPDSHSSRAIDRTRRGQTEPRFEVEESQPGSSGLPRKRFTAKYDPRTRRLAGS